MPVLTASGKNVGFQLGRGQEVTKFSEPESSIPGRLPGYVSFSCQCTDCSSPLKVSERIDFHCSSLFGGLLTFCRAVWGQNTQYFLFALWSPSLYGLSLCSLFVLRC